MTDGKIGSDGIALGMGDGPNRLELNYNHHRVRLDGTLGYVGRMAFKNGRVYYGAGGQAAFAINTEPSSLNLGTDHARHPDKITLREAAALAIEARHKTNGSFNLDTIPLVSALDTIGRYPALLAHNRGEAASGFKDSFNDTKRGVEESRAIAYATYDANGVLAQYPELRRLLGQSVTSHGLEALTLGDLRRNAVDALMEIKKFDAETKIITGPHDAALLKISDWLMAQSPPIKMTSEQKEMLLDGLRKAPSELEALQDKLADTISPTEVKKFYETSTRIASYDPVLDVTGYVAAAHELPLGKAALLTGAVLGQGVRLNSDTVYAKRDAEGHSHLHVDTASITSRLAFVGVGSNAFNAMPTDAAYKLGITPESGLGGYVVAQQSTVKFLDDKARSSAVGIGLKFSESSGSNGLTYVEVGATHEKKPGQTPAKELRASIGRIF